MNLNKQDLVGRWESATNTLVILSDGRFTFEHEPRWFLAIIPVLGVVLFEKFSGHWDIVDDNLTIQPNEGVLEVWRITAFSQNEVTLINESKVTIRYKRKLT